MIRWVLAELWADKIRMGLVALGVLWGTLGMASLLSFGGEMLRATTQTSRNFGVDLLRVSGASTTSSWRGQAPGRRVPLELGDEEVIAALPGVRGAVWEELSGSQLSRAGERRHNGTIMGTQPDFGRLRSKRAIAGGRFLSARDVREHRSVCYLGSNAAANLFGDEDPVGQEVEVLGRPLRVVGVGLRRIQTSNYEGLDWDKIYLPITTFQTLAGPAYGDLVVGLTSADEAPAVQKAMREALARIHDFDPSDLPALNIADYVEQQKRIGTILDGNRALTAVVAILGFLVAALGVANATWARVEEKRREIGLAMALGARRVHVMLPPLLEASITTLVGGLAGLIMAAGIFGLAAAVDAPLEVRAYLGTPRVSLALGAAVVLALSLIGALCGLLPARQAASVDPIEVLRDE